MKSFATLFILAVTAALCAVSAESAVKRFSLPEVKYADLVTQDAATARDLVHYLTSLGGVQVTGIPRFSEVRRRALQDLAQCLSSEKTAPAMTMADGARRVSTGAASRSTATMGTATLAQTDSPCGEAATKLRVSVDHAMSLVFASLDALLTAKGEHAPLMDPHYETFQALLGKGEHLEHLHSYFAPTNTNTASAGNAAEKKSPLDKSTLQLHTDAGLMIAMTAGYYTGVFDAERESARESERGLYLSLPDGSLAKAQVDEDDALLVLLGDGATNWLRPVFGAPLRAMPHALVADLPAGSAATRSWYGKMYLPPRDALIPDSSLSFARFSERQRKLAAPLHTEEVESEREEQREQQQLLPSACGGELGNRQLLTVAVTCNASEIYCWMRCMSIAELPCSSDTAICWDPTLQDVWAGVTHCKTCSPVCHAPSAEPTFAPSLAPTHLVSLAPTLAMKNNHSDSSSLGGASSADSDNYCNGEGTSMFMTGFVSAAREGSGNFECVNLLWPEWTLDSRVKLAFGCLGVFLGCVLIQFLTKLRAGLQIQDELQKRVVNTLLFGVQITLSYFAMLVAMTYSVELFCMVCSGLTAGYALFHAGSNSNNNSHSGKDQAMESCCCADDGQALAVEEKKEDGSCCVAVEFVDEKGLSV